MRSAVAVPESVYASRLADADRGAWRASCTRMSDLIAARPQPTSTDGVWLDPHRQVLMQAAALLIYAVAHERSIDPVSVTAGDLRGWLDTHCAPQPESRREVLAATLNAAGHVLPLTTSRYDRREWDTTDPVVVTWLETVFADDHVATLDGTFGVSLEWGLQQLAALLA
jgi:hypothetical protein